jgi:hypothetical protein
MNMDIQWKILIVQNSGQKADAFPLPIRPIGPAPRSGKLAGAFAGRQKPAPGARLPKAQFHLCENLTKA